MATHAAAQNVSKITHRPYTMRAKAAHVVGHLRLIRRAVHRSEAVRTTRGVGAVRGCYGTDGELKGKAVSPKDTPLTGGVET
jgi:hypothetical protein